MFLCHSQTYTALVLHVLKAVHYPLSRGCTEEPVLKDCPIGYKNMVSHGKWSLAPGSIALRCKTVCLECMVLCICLSGYILQVCTMYSLSLMYGRLHFNFPQSADSGRRLYVHVPKPPIDICGKLKTCFCDKKYADNEYKHNLKYNEYKHNLNCWCISHST